MKKLASTDTRLTSRRIVRASWTTSFPNTRAEPPSSISNVDNRRTSVDLPDPFWPRMATHSPRAIVKLTSFNAGMRRRRRENRPASLARRRKTLVRCSTSTAGTSRRTDVLNDLGAARADMLLLCETRNGTENFGRPPQRRCADLAAARDRRAAEATRRDRVHHVQEQHRIRTIGV